MTVILFLFTEEGTDMQKGFEPALFIWLVLTSSDCLTHALDFGGQWELTGYSENFQSVFKMYMKLCVKRVSKESARR